MEELIHKNKISPNIYFKDVAPFLQGLFTALHNLEPARNLSMKNIMVKNCLHVTLFQLDTTLLLTGLMQENSKPLG